ncbi:MAG: helicase-related protein, partial [Campylobacterota bacterium]|nr:helicase-related protein [Campylobacterota bacterium]
QLRLGKFDVLIGINLLREGLDIPEASLVAILDADKEGFLRSKTSLVQTMGRAARNSNGKVILFAKKITDSMKFAIETTENRRKIQEAHNKEHGITPTTTIRRLDEDLKMEEYDETALKIERMDKMPAVERKKMLIELNKQMNKAAKDLNFEEAIRLRDEIDKIKKL